jgi:hypothetical protein
MNIQDRKKSFTAEELRIRYNLDGLDKDRKAIQLIRETLNKVEIEFQRFIDLINSSFEEYPSQVEITTWFFDGIPTSTQPEFTTPSDHLGDFYYDRQTGKAYQYVYENSEYIWQEKIEPIVIETLAIENSKADTGDNKRLVFNTTPTTPYSIGDVWEKDGTYYRCRCSRESGVYNIADWIIYTSYNDDMVLLDTRAVLDQLVQNVTENYVTTTQLETNTQGIYASVAETYSTITQVEGIDDKVETNRSNIATLQINTDSISQEVSSQTTAINELGETISQINSVIQEQTSDAITTWFNQSGIQGTLDDLQQAIDNNDADIDTIKVYIREGVLDGNPYIELGKADNQTIIRILPERIQFLTNGEETAYISNNSLYINESTILTRQQIGHWVTVEDNANNLNTYWVD